jgi:hypothetical protein
LIFELDIEAKDAIAQEGLFLIEAIADAGLEATASGAVLVDVVDENSWVQPARNEDVVAELSIFRLQQARERAIELIELGRTYEADQLLRQAGLDVDELKKLIGLSERTRNRVHQSSNEFESYLGMSLEEKKKRLYEAKNRSMRNRRDFRDEK